MGMVDVLEADVYLCCLTATRRERAEFDTHGCGKRLKDFRGLEKIMIHPSTIKGAMRKHVDGLTTRVGCLRQ